MDDNRNFERAKKLTEEWPAWKREYQLTKSPDNSQKWDASPENHRNEEESRVVLQKDFSS